MLETIIFDLDGTLADTSRDIASAVNFIRTGLGLNPLTVHEVIMHVGSGVTQLIEKTIPRADVPKNELRNLIINRYEDHLLDETILYPGIRPLLEMLRGVYRLAVATNKPEMLAKKTVAGLDIAGFFEIVAGPETAGVGKPDPAMLELIAAKAGSKKESCLMVGDSPIDVATAVAFGCHSCGVTWGYNEISTLCGSKPDYIIDAPADLLDLLEGPLKIGD